MKAWFIIFVLLLPGWGVAQKSGGDLQKNWTPVNDTARIDSLNALSVYYILDIEKEDSAIFYMNAANSDSKRIHYIHGLAVSLLRASNIAEHFHGDFRRAKKLAEESMFQIEQTGNKANFPEICGQLAYVNYVTGNYLEAMKIAEETLKLYEAKRDENGECDIFSLMAVIQIKKGEFEKGFENSMQGLDLAVKSKDSSLIKASLIQLGELCMAIEDYPLALHYYRMVYENFTNNDLKIQKKAEFDVWSQMEFAEIYSHLHMFDSALLRYNLFDTLHAPEKDLRVFLGSKGEYFMLTHDYETALRMLLRALDMIQSENDENEDMRTLLDIANTYHALHKDKQALIYAYQGLNLSLLIDNHQFIRDGYKILYNIYDSQGKTDSAYSYYRSYIISKEIIDADQTKGKFATYNYEQKIELLNGEKQINQQKIKIQEQRLKSETLFRNIMIAFAFSILVVSFLLLRNNRLKRRNEKLIDENTRKELEHKTTEMEMQALRAQMNPHFIFNCLNSINRFIMKNESETASDYLTRFSRLIRLVLTNSKRAWIPLEDEIDMLKLYLEMEKLRFKDSFEYSIHCDDQIDACAVFIPPLLLQPFVENAIWHGLMHKKGNGQVTISFKLENEVLHCTVLDDGVGRSVAENAGSKSTQTHKSMGIQITRERLALINGNTRYDKVAFNIEDRLDSKGQPAGTMVSLKIRFQQNHELINNMNL